MATIQEIELTEQRTEQANLALTPAEKTDLVRRAGEVQALSGVPTSLAEYIRSQLWPAA